MGSGDEPALELSRETAAYSGVNGRREDSADSRGCSGAAGEPEGGRKLLVYARKTDASRYLDHWLGKYGSLEDIQQLAGEFASD